MRLPRWRLVVLLLLLLRIADRRAKRGHGVSGTCSVWYGAESGTDSAAAKTRGWKNALGHGAADELRGSDEAGHQ